ncbi:MAG: GspE/PulE family protein [Planctomycetota bacterium]|nr:GspE/PulE family protein [Planctomycetota bacterium]
MGCVAISPAVETVERLLQQASRAGASDLHLDPGEQGVLVSLRTDGVLKPLETLSRLLGPHVVGRLKALADLLAYRTDLPQEGRIPADRSGIDAEVRVATYPTLFGERVALRFDAPEGQPQDLDTLGLGAPVLAALQAALNQPEGVILLTGPSGSGKTTTLYSALRHVAASEPRRSIVTVEDPVERRIEGVVQTQVNPAAGLTFARALRSLLRQDPEVLLVGEIRDAETAKVALEAGLTGHLVASTVHAGTAPQVFTRLLEMGVEPFVLTTAVRGVMAQRLLRKRRTDGGEGYQGRVLVAEWVPLSSGLREAVLARADGEELTRRAREDGCRGLREEAQSLVDAGITTQEEVDRVLGLA